MGFKCGIVGLPNVGKLTLFNALTQTAAAQAANYPFCTIEPNVGEIAVPDPRLEKLAVLAKSAEIIPTRISFVDIAGLVRGASKGEGLEQPVPCQYPRGGMHHSRRALLRRHRRHACRGQDRSDCRYRYHRDGTDACGSRIAREPRRRPGEKAKGNDKEAKETLGLGWNRALALLREGHSRRRAAQNEISPKKRNCSTLTGSADLMPLYGMYQRRGGVRAAGIASGTRRSARQGRRCHVGRDLGGKYRIEIATLPSDEVARTTSGRSRPEETGLDRFSTGRKLCAAAGHPISTAGPQREQRSDDH